MPLSAPDDLASGWSSMLPSETLQFRRVVFSARIAQAEIADECPLRRDVQHGRNDWRIEDRHPAQAEIHGPRGEPECMDGHHRGVGGGFRHGRASQTAALFRAWV